MAKKLEQRDESPEPQVTEPAETERPSIASDLLEVHNAMGRVRSTAQGYSATKSRRIIEISEDIEAKLLRAIGEGSVSELTLGLPNETPIGYHVSQEIKLPGAPEIIERTGLDTVRIETRFQPSRIPNLFVITGRKYEVPPAGQEWRFALVGINKIAPAVREKLSK